MSTDRMQLVCEDSQQEVVETKRRVGLSWAILAGVALTGGAALAATRSRHEVERANPHGFGLLQAQACARDAMGLEMGKDQLNDFVSFVEGSIPDVQGSFGRLMSMDVGGLIERHHLSSRCACGVREYIENTIRNFVARAVESFFSCNYGGDDCDYTKHRMEEFETENKFSCMDDNKICKITEKMVSCQKDDQDCDEDKLAQQVQADCVDDSNICTITQKVSEQEEGCKHHLWLVGDVCIPRVCFDEAKVAFIVISEAIGRLTGQTDLADRATIECKGRVECDDVDDIVNAAQQG